MEGGVNLAKSERKTLYEAHYFVSRICASNFFFLKRREIRNKFLKRHFQLGGVVHSSSLGQPCSGE